MELLDPDAIARLLADHPAWVAGILFGVVFVEALVGVGYLIPAATVLFSAGALAASGAHGFLPAVLGAFGGATLGGATSFRLGGRFAARLPELWLFRRYPGLLERNRAFVARHGGKAVFLGRFNKAFRPSVTAVAGMMSMDPRLFRVFNPLGALAWALAYLGAGYLLGRSASFTPGQAVQLSALLLSLTVLAALAAVVVRRRRARTRTPALKTGKSTPD